MEDMDKLIELGRKYRASLENKKRYNARRKEEMLANPDDESHGKFAGYVYGCRCERCRAANAEHARRERRKRRERSRAEAAGHVGQERGAQEAIPARDAHE